MRRLFKWVAAVDWWVVSAVLLLIAAAVITGVDIFDQTSNSVDYRNALSWLETAVVAFALFSLRGSLFDLRGEQMRRAYDPTVRRRDV